MADRPRPKKRKVKMTCYVPLEIKKSVQHEAIDRGMSIGEVLQEALERRNTVIINDSNNKKN